MTRRYFERRTSDDIKNMQGIIASKDEEIMQLSGGVDAGLAQEREEELIRRVEEEEAKVLAMERLLSEKLEISRPWRALYKKGAGPRGGDEQSQRFGGKECWSQPGCETGAARVGGDALSGACPQDSTG